MNIIEKIEFSGITKEQIRLKIKYLREVQVPNRTVYLERDDEEIVLHWFKNWLHPKLKRKHNKPNIEDYKLKSDQELKLFNKRYNLFFYENGQFNFKYDLKTIEDWLNN